MKSFLFLLTLPFFFIACQSNKNSKTEILTINSYKVDCMGVAPTSCFQVKKEGEDTWQMMSQNIEGFDYKPGRIYKVSVNIEIIPQDQVPADGSSLKYSLIEVLEEMEDPKLALQNIWAIEEWERGSDTSALFMDLPILEINLPQEKVMLESGCFRIEGALMVGKSGELSISDMALQTDSCPNNVLSQKMMDYFSRINHYEIIEGGLHLGDQNHEHLFVLKPID